MPNIKESDMAYKEHHKIEWSRVVVNESRRPGVQMKIRHWIRCTVEVSTKPDRAVEHYSVHEADAHSLH